MDAHGSLVVAVGEHVELRFPCSADKGAFVDLVEASDQVRPRWVPGPQGPEGVDAERWFELNLAANGTGRNVKLLVFRRSDGALLGNMNFNEIVRGSFQNAFLGYWIGDAHLRQGYGAEALVLALEYGFGTLGLHRVEANIQPENEASIALVKSVGFRYEGLSARYLQIGGVWRDHQRWACTVEDRLG